MNLDELRLRIIGAVPFLRRRYLASLRWQLSADESKVVFNKPVPANMNNSFVYGRRVANGRTVVMSVYLCGESILPASQWRLD